MLDTGEPRSKRTTRVRLPATASVVRSRRLLTTRMAVASIPVAAPSTHAAGGAESVWTQVVPTTTASPKKEDEEVPESDVGERVGTAGVGDRRHQADHPITAMTGPPRAIR